MTDNEPGAKIHSNRVMLDGSGSHTARRPVSPVGADAADGRTVSSIPLLIARRDVALEPCSS